MEELLLDPLLVLEELDVVDHEHVVVAVPLLEAFDAPVAKRVDEVVHERLAGHVAHRQPARVVGDVVGDRLEQVRLAKAGSPVDEERVVRPRRRFGYSQSRRVRETVRRADDKEVERVLRVDADGRLARRLLRIRRRQRVVDDQPDDHAIATGSVSHRCSDEVQEVALDPLAGEVVRHREHERVTFLGRPHFAEPGSVRRVVQSPPEPTGDLIPQRPGGQLACFHASGVRLLGLTTEWSSIAPGWGPYNGWKSLGPLYKNHPISRDFLGNCEHHPQLWNVSVARRGNA